MISVAAALRWASMLVLFAVAIEGARRVALAVGAVAQPNPVVRTHREPVPYLGGPALVITWLAVLGVSWGIGGAAGGRGSIARAACALALVAFGTWDDLRAFGPKVKLAVQITVCAAYLVLAGPPAPLLGLFQLLVLVSLVNAFNLIDVMDGLLCLLTTIAVLGLLATPGLVPDAMRPELEILLVGLVAFFLFNRPPARIYNGDAGSMTLGFLVGAWLLETPGEAPPLNILSLVGLVAAPALELSLLIPARIARGISPLRASPDHFALRLQDQCDWSKWRVLATTAVLGAGFALAPFLAFHLSPRTAALVALVEVGLGVALWRALWRIPPIVERRM